MTTTSPSLSVKSCDFHSMTPTQRDGLDAALGEVQRSLLAAGGYCLGWSSHRFATGYRYETTDATLCAFLLNIRGCWGDGPNA